MRSRVRIGPKIYQADLLAKPEAKTGGCHIKPRVTSKAANNNCQVLKNFSKFSLTSFESNTQAILVGDISPSLLFISATRFKIIILDFDADDLTSSYLK